MRAVVVGAGASARDLLRRLGDNWDVVIIDPDESRLAAAGEIRPVEAILGDGSSSLVLDRAGIDQASVVVVATGDDDVNITAARLASERDVDHVVALVRQPSRTDEYRAMGITTIIPAHLTARAVEADMEPRKVASTAFADGKAEAIEFQITPDSPVEGKALKDMHSEIWVVAAILRAGKLVVPHGTTKLLTNDRVTVVGSANSYAQIVRTFAGGVSRFPLRFGQNVVVGLESPSDLTGVVAEAAFFVRNSNAAALTVVHRDVETVRNTATAEALAVAVESLSSESLGVEVMARPVAGSITKGILETAAHESVGVIAMPMPSRSIRRPFAGVAPILNAFDKVGVPVLLTKGEPLFRSILTPATRSVSGDIAGRAAIDIARRSGTKVIGVAVANPVFMGADDLMEKRNATAWLRREASVQDVDVERHVVRGNPVKVIAGATTSDSLLVVSTPPRSVGRFRPPTSVWAASRSSGSVLFVPSDA